MDGLAESAKSFESIAAYAWTFNFLMLDEGSESLQGMPVTSDYFRVMGLQPVMGRTFTEAEGRPGSAPVIIIGYELWQRKFNGDPNIIGKPMRMSRMETPPTIIGVMPPGIRFLPVPGASKEPNYNVNARVAVLGSGGAEPRAIEPARDGMSSRVCGPAFRSSRRRRN